MDVGCEVAVEVGTARPQPRDSGLLHFDWGPLRFDSGLLRFDPALLCFDSR